MIKKSKRVLFHGFILLLVCVLFIISQASKTNITTSKTMFNEGKITMVEAATTQEATLDEYDKLRIRWENYLIGENLDVNDSRTKEYIDSIQRVADSAVKAEDSGNHGYGNLRAMAMAYRTPGTTYYGDEETCKKIVDALEYIYNNSYNKKSSFRNWWGVEVGNPLRLLDTLVLMYDKVSQKNIKKYTDVVIYFKDAYSKSQGGNLETGANLVWKCNNLMLVGILQKDKSWFDWVNKNLPTTLQYAKTFTVPTTNSSHGYVYDDGFQVDGSFIQHYFFAYTGGYGKHFINILAGMMYAYDGSEYFTLDNKHKEFLYKMIFDAYEPLIYNGRFMDMVRGRELTRGNYQDYMPARHVIRSLSYLSELMPKEEQTRAKSMIKYWLMQNDTGEKIFYDPTNQEYYAQGSLVKVIQDIENDDTIKPRGELLLHKTYGIMEKVVHLAKGYGFAVSMYSPNIAAYEYLNGEGSKMWHFSDGMTYLYTSDADQYSGNYFATADMQRLAGTTVDRNANRATDQYYNWINADSKNVYSWAGGSDIDGLYGIAGLQYRGQGIGLVRDLEVKKSWFMFDDEVVAIGSGITSTTGDPIETIVDNKKLLTDGSNKITINGTNAYTYKKVSGAYKKTKTIHVTGNTDSSSDIGYYFPGGTNLNVLGEHRNSGTFENNFVTFWFAHGKKPKNATYAYVVLPGKSVEETEAYAKNPDIEIIENTSSAHAVRENKLDMLGVNFWNTKSYTSAGITSSTQASVILKGSDNGYEIAVSDPTKSNRTIKLQFEFDIKSIESSDDNIKILSKSPLKISVNTKGAQGQSLRLKVITK